eukprot:15309446-Alexandrium_andersonii.AAC.1
MALRRGRVVHNRVLHFYIDECFSLRARGALHVPCRLSTGNGANRCCGLFLFNRCLGSFAAHQHCFNVSCVCFFAVSFVCDTWLTHCRRCLFCVVANVAAPSRFAML